MIVKAKVKYIQSLSQKKLRDEEGVFVAEGPKIVNELLASPNIQPLEIYATGDWTAPSGHAHFAGITRVDDSWLRRISFQPEPQQVLGVFHKPQNPALHLADRITLMADAIQDPGNLGSMLRCADWFGVPQLVCSRDCADAFSPKAIQASMGSIARVAVYYGDLLEIIEAHPSVSAYATTLSGENLLSAKPLTKGIVMIGNESRGINERLLALSAHKITIPRAGGAESLNAAIATGIVLSHLVRPAIQH